MLRMLSCLSEGIPCCIANEMLETAATISTISSSEIWRSQIEEVA